MQQLCLIHVMEEDENYVFEDRDWATHEEDPQLEQIALLIGKPEKDARERLEEIRNIRPIGPV